MIPTISKKPGANTPTDAKSNLNVDHNHTYLKLYPRQPIRLELILFCVIMVNVQIRAVYLHSPTRKTTIPEFSKKPGANAPPDVKSNLNVDHNHTDLKLYPRQAIRLELILFRVFMVNVQIVPRHR